MKQNDSAAAAAAGVRKRPFLARSSPVSLDEQGVQLSDITNPVLLRSMVSDLWELLDDIDTLEDVCKSDDIRFRQYTSRRHKKRFDILTSDGYNLFLPLGK